MREQTTNPDIVAMRLRSLKSYLLRTNAEMAELFGVTELSMIRWTNGKFAPLLKHQRTLERLERVHGLRD